MLAYLAASRAPLLDHHTSSFDDARSHFQPHHYFPHGYHYHHLRSFGSHHCHGRLQLHSEDTHQQVHFDQQPLRKFVAVAIEEQTFQNLG